MGDIFRKLNLKDQTTLVVLDCPASFEPELGALEGVVVKRSLDDKAEPEFLLAFVRSKADIERLGSLLPLGSEKDPILWFAYPKGSSKAYTSDVNRDTGWEPIRALGLDTVRQVSIDDDWSALRFRKAKFIGSGR